MRVRAKTSGGPWPIWTTGEYITEPPIRPVDGAKRPVGHYIDKGGYPGANVWEVNPDTLCRETTAADSRGNAIFENDILLYETEQEIGYFIIQDTETAVDIINGEIVGVADLQAKDIKIIGNMVDFPDFVEGVRYCVDNEKEIPYLPALDVQETPYPYLKMTCLKCKHTFLSCAYMTWHKDCGGYLITDFATKIYRKSENKEKAFA